MQIIALRCVALFFIISKNAGFDQVEFIKEHGAEMCPYTNFCHTRASRSLNNDTLIPCCLPCDCGENCWQAGNCCPDQTVGTNQLKCKPTIVKRTFYYDLYYPGYTNGIKRYRIVDDCLSGESNKTLTRLCKGKNKQTIEEYTWVSEKLSGKIYQNRFCAICNNVTNFVDWQIRTRYPLVLLSNASNLPQSFLFDDADLVVEIPDAEKQIIEKYRCVISHFTKCNESGLWNHYNENIESLCDIYDSPVATNTVPITLYKNIYCFICNTQTLGSIEPDCPNWYDTGRSIIGIVFSAIIDFTKFQNEEYELHEKVCGVDEVFDKFMSRCHSLICPFGSTPVDGRCESVAVQTEGLSVQTDYNLQVIQNGSNICPDEIQKYDKSTLGHIIKNQFTKALGNRKSQCPVCSSRIRMMEVMPETTSLDLVLSFSLYTDPGCQLESVFILATEIIGERMRVVVDKCLNISLEIRLEKRTQRDIRKLPLIYKWGSQCNPMVLITKEKVCPEIKLASSDLLSRLGERAYAKAFPLLKAEEKMENRTVTVCWSDYLSIMSQTKASSVQLMPALKMTLLGIATYQSLIKAY